MNFDNMINNIMKPKKRKNNGKIKSNKSFDKVITKFKTKRFFSSLKPIKNIGVTSLNNNAINNFGKFGSIKNNFINHNKGASIKSQKQWSLFNSNKRNILRIKHKDSDGDRVPDKFDCEPFNTMRQHRYNNIVKETNNEIIYQNPEGWKIIYIKDKRNKSSIDDIAYMIDNLSGRYNKSDIVYGPPDKMNVYLYDAMFNEDEVNNNDFLMNKNLILKNYENKLRAVNGMQFHGKKYLIFLNSGVLPNKLRSTIIHEMGHNVWGNEPYAKEQWDENIWPIDSPTDYGSTNDFEDFAESFSIWQGGGKKVMFKLSDDRLRIFEDTLGRPFTIREKEEIEKSPNMIIAEAKLKEFRKK